MNVSGGNSGARQALASVGAAGDALGEALTEALGATLLEALGDAALAALGAALLGAIGDALPVSLGEALVPVAEAAGDGALDVTEARALGADGATRARDGVALGTARSEEGGRKRKNAAAPPAIRRPNPARSGTVKLLACVGSASGGGTSEGCPSTNVAVD